MFATINIIYRKNWEISEASVLCSPQIIPDRQQCSSPHSLSFHLYYLGVWCDCATSQDPRTNPPFKANQMIEMPGTFPSIYVLFKHCFIQFFFFFKYISRKIKRLHTCYCGNSKEVSPRDKNRTIIWPRNSTFDMYPKTRKQTIAKILNTHTHTPVFIASLFTIAKTWNQPKCCVCKQMSR